MADGRLEVGSHIHRDLCVRQEASGERTRKYHEPFRSCHQGIKLWPGVDSPMLSQKVDY